MVENNSSYTPEEVAKILKISRFTVYEMIKRGDLAAYRIGRKARIEAADLEEYIRKSKNQAGNQPVKAVLPLSEKQEIILCGQDVLLDILARRLEGRMPQVRFLRQFFGSIDGLLSLYRGEANAVTAHLWDSDTDEYNLPFIRRLVPGHKTVVINLAFRMEGFYVQSTNPKQIFAWSDLVRSDVRFVNRECGAGARVLVDEKLRFHKIEPQAVKGYNEEERSHLAVASRVARGDADVGVGIEKAALQVAGIDFIPLQKERYDLVIRKDDLSLPHFKVLLEELSSVQFKSEIAGLGGYDLSKTGQVIAEI